MELDGARVFKAVITLVLALFGLPVTYSTAGAAQSSQPFESGWYLIPQRLVDIGRRRLNVLCLGEGSPAVILEAGLGDSNAAFRMVQARIAHKTRVCSYDRAGMGFSDPGPLPRDASAVTSDLHALLRIADIQGPYILVGHSIGGMYARLYADRYPADVAGMVFIDPAFPFEWRAWEAASPSYKRFLNSTPMTAPYFSDACIAAAESGALKTDPGLQLKCGLDTPAALRKECLESSAGTCSILTLENRVQWTRPEYMRQVNSEYKMFQTRSSEEVAREQSSYGAKPIIVLTATNEFSFPFKMSKAEKEAIFEAWKMGHDRIAALSTRGVNFVIDGSGHYVQYDRPSAVISAVDEVVDQVRYAKVPL